MLIYDSKYFVNIARGIVTEKLACYFQALIE